MVHIHGEVGTHPDLQAVHENMVTGLGQLADYFGFSKVIGQLYATLLLNNGPLSLDEIGERLSISKAGVSTNMRTLEHLGMVRRVWTHDSGDRRKFYEAQTDFWQIITNVLHSREMRDVERAINTLDRDTNRLQAALGRMTPEDRALAQLYITRIEEIEGLFRFAQFVISTVLAQVENGPRDFQVPPPPVDDPDDDA